MQLIKINLEIHFNVIKITGKSIDGVNSKILYYSSHDNNSKIIKGDFKIKNFKHGCLLQFIEDEFSNHTATINVIKNDTILTFDTQKN